MENPIQDIPVDIEVDLNSSPSTHVGNQGLSTEPTSVVVENDETRKRASTSKVWQHVTRFKANDGYPMAKCNYCPKTFKAHTKRNGTTSMKNHIESCPKNPAVIAAKERESVTSTNLLDEIWGVHRTLLQLQNHTSNEYDPAAETKEQKEMDKLGLDLKNISLDANIDT
ncbi:putative Zinc finger, BED-type [Corchorus olitorius]|uniref:Zinc finger, BED-type n=1 Tax=Corchorus olitorius TaxID=93759 RepID=A0A1R3HLG6_9ROSI|nr:putative Zinc finger, BED-type [Corchorus olitorius]